MNISVGQQIGRYQLVERLGEGGMACVYKAYDQRLDRFVALKVILSSQMQSESYIKRFEREAKSLAKFSHPNIVNIHDYGDLNGIPYLVMEYISGGTLKNRMGAPVPYKEAARLIIPIADALEYAHHRDIIHRDIKPANILMTESGIPMLSDFGIAKDLHAGQHTQLTAVGVGIGTPEYMSPEQGRGMNIDLRSDIYSLGVVFYELITGRKPFRADTPMATILKHITDPLPKPSQYVPDLPETVEMIIYKVMAKRPEDRYQSMAEFSRALTQIAYEGAQVSPLSKQQTVLRPKTQSTVGEPPKTAFTQADTPSIPPQPIIKMGTTTATQPYTSPNILQPVYTPAISPAVKAPRPAWFWVAIGGGITLVVACIIVAAGLASGYIFDRRNKETLAVLVATATLVVDENTPTVVEATTPPETAAATPHPQPPTIANKATAAEAWDNSQSIDEFIQEHYTVEEENTVGATLKYTANLETSKPLIWSRGWCATSTEILSDNISKISFSFYLDQKFIEPNRLSSYKGQSTDGYECIWFYALLDNWKTGEHLLVSKLNIITPINDGENDYSTGEMIDEILVTVK